jgi:hypothetical protein
MKRFFALAMVVVLSTCASLLDSLRARAGGTTGRIDRFCDASRRPYHHRRNGRVAPVEIISRRIPVPFSTDERDTLAASRRAA